MTDLLKQAVSPLALNLAWQKCRNDHAPWDVRVSRQEFEKNMVGHLLTLSESLRCGTYRPGPVRFFPVAKGNGGQRIISAGYLKDKLAQRAVLAVIGPLGEAVFHHDSYAYRPGRTIDMALSRAREYICCGNRWVVDGDIQACFDNIPHKPLMKKCSKLIKDRSILELVRGWLAAGAVKRGLLGRDRGLPQGMILSPFLCNLYLTAWDDFMTGHGFCFVRFADDFLVFAAGEKEALKALACARKGFKRLGLNLNAEKTRIAPCGPGVTFLGKRLPAIHPDPPAFENKRGNNG